MDEIGKMSRRSFLKLSASATMATAGLLFLQQSPLNALVRGQGSETKDKWVPTGCVGCVGWCPIKVRVVNGKAVAIKGNENSVWTNGKICPKAMLNLQILYDPDRVKKPLKRTNPNKGRDEDPGWVEITWDEALNTIVSKLKELRDNGTPERFVMLRGRYDKGAADIFYSRFTKAYGTPNNISHSSLCAESTKGGRWLALGDYDYSGLNWYEANYIISFGNPFLESHRPGTGIFSAFGKIRERSKPRAKIVMVDPRYSVTALKSDEWIAINPGTDGALALGMAHVILTEGLWDKTYVGDFDPNAPVQGFESGNSITEEYIVGSPTFIENSTTGLLKWWNAVLKDFTPEVAAQKTGISAETIKRLAREFANASPAMAIWGRGADAWPNGLFNGYAIVSLNALVGSIEKLVTHRPSVKFTSEAVPLDQDQTALDGVAKPRLDEKGTKKFPRAKVVTNNVADNILNDNPYPVEVILAWWSNFAYSAPGSKRWEQVFKKVPLVIHHTTHLSETSIYADIILPAKSYLEKWAFGYPAGTAGSVRGATLFQPVITPLYDCKSEIELAIELGKKLGEHFPSIKNSFDGIGGPYGDTAEGYTRQRTEEQYQNFPNGWDDFRKIGTTNISYSPKTSFKTPSTKFEFYSGVLQEKFNDLGMTDDDLTNINIKSRGDALYVPHFEEPAFIGDKETYPLVLISYKTMLNQEGRSANTQWAQEISNVLLGEGWNNFAEINPETAKKFNIKDGDEIIVESEVGKLKTIAKVFPGIHPDIVAIAYGQGHFAYGRNAKNIGVNPNEITGVMYDHITGMSTYYNTRVKIYKA